MSGLPELDGDLWRGIVVVAAFLAAAHAYVKLSPYFCVTWFGAGLVFGWRWGGERYDPAILLLPVVVTYLAAALTKGLVETRGGVRGNHVVHVFLTGLLTAVVALPIEAMAGAMGWSMPRQADRELFGVDGDVLGGPTLDVLVLWALVGTVWYGTYKVLDHIGLSKPLQTVLLFVAAPFLVPAVLWLHGKV